MANPTSPSVASVWAEWCYENSGKERQSQDSIINNNTKEAKNKNVNALTSKSLNGNAWISTRGQTNPSGRETPNSLIQNEHSLPNEPTNSSTTHSTLRMDHVYGDIWRRSPPKHGHMIGNLRPNKASLIPPSPTYPSTVPVLNSSYSKTTCSTPLGRSLSSTLNRSTPSALSAIGQFPANGVSLKPPDHLASINCSDLIRSLAAKYNHSNNTFNSTNYGLNDYFGTLNGGFSRSLLPGICLFPSNSGAPSNLNPTFNTPLLSPQGDLKTDLSINREYRRTSLGAPSSGVHPSYVQNGFAQCHPFPLIDVSSTHMIFDMVRNASPTQPSTLETYLRGATKRPAESPPSPLDLSSSVATKRRKKSGSQIKGSTSEDEEENSTSLPTSSPTSKPLSVPSPGNNTDKVPIGVSCGDRDCPSLASVLRWTVEDVCDFVQSIDLCAEYVETNAIPSLTEVEAEPAIEQPPSPAFHKDNLFWHKSMEE